MLIWLKNQRKVRYRTFQLRSQEEASAKFQVLCAQSAELVDALATVPSGPGPLATVPSLPFPNGTPALALTDAALAPDGGLVEQRIATTRGAHAGCALELWRARTHGELVAAEHAA